MVGKERGIKPREVLFKRLHPEAKMPEYAHPGDAGFDLFSNEDYTLNPGDDHGFMLGFSTEIPEGFFVSFRDKSGLGIEHQIKVLGGVIDAGFRGEWKVGLINLGKKSHRFNKGDKIAQGILQPVERAAFRAVDQIGQSERGEGGFGSTGRK